MRLRETASSLTLALRMLQRDFVSGRITLILVATSLAVATTVSVSLIASRVEQVLVAESSNLLAGDLALVSRHPIPETDQGLARMLGLSVSHTATLRSVVTHAGRLQLVRLKAVSAEYPLRGKLRVARSLQESSSERPKGPAPGEAWADPRLFQLLKATPGDTLSVGNRKLVLSQMLLTEPDYGGDLFALAPRVMIALEDLDASGLVLPASRLTHTMQVAGSPEMTARLRSRLELRPGDKLIEPQAARPEIQGSFDQARRFLALAAFVGVMLAAIGISLSALSYRDHQEPTIALLKTLGLERAQIHLIVGIELLLMALLASTLGGGSAWLFHLWMLHEFAPRVFLARTVISGVPFLHGGVTAVLVLGGCALPAMNRLCALPVSTILLRDRRLPAGLGYKALLSVLLTLICAAPWYLGNAKLIAIGLAGICLSAALIAGLSLLLLQVVTRLRSHTGVDWRFGLAALARRARLSVVQSTALGLGIAIILLLGLIRGDLMAQWTARLPERAPNQFLINIQPTEVEALASFLTARGVPDTRFYPMIRGRLVEINDTAVDPEAYEDARARRLADREFNLSYAEKLKPDNRLEAGRWWSSGASAELSVEIGLAETLGIELNDELRFQVADKGVTGRVTSLRHVEWDSFEVNFFVVSTPDLLTSQPATFITSFFLESEQRSLLSELVAEFPSVTVIDVDTLMTQIRGVMQRIGASLTWVFSFALAAGIVVLVAAIQAGQQERRLDVAVLKTLGASRRFIFRATLTEFVAIGAVAGVTGAAGACALGWAIAFFVLKIPYAPATLTVLTGVGLGVAVVGAVGLAAAVFTHRRAASTVLRQAD